MTVLDLSKCVCQTGPVADRDWERLARHVRERREELGLTQEEVASRGGPSTATLRLIENNAGDSYRQKSLRQLEDALGWARGSVLAILAGEEPALRGGQPAAQRYADPTLQAIWELPGLTEEERRIAVAFIEAIRKGRAQRDTAHPAANGGLSG